MQKLYIVISLNIITFFAYAQKEDFLQEFKQVNESFLLQKNVSLVQKYFLYTDSVTNTPVDSSSCTIVKNKSALHYNFNGFEYFSDSGYFIQISPEENYLYITKTLKIDFSTINPALNEGFAHYSTFKKHTLKNKKSYWEIAGGNNGIISMNVVIDTRENRIDLLLITFSANHPFISQFRKNDQQGNDIVLKVEYHYSSNAGKNDFTKLSDFITINNEMVQPSLKFKDYKIQLLN